MRSQIFKAIGGTLVTLALTTAPAYASPIMSADRTAEVGVAGCGWDPDYTGAYYNHCNSNNIVIRIQRYLMPDCDRRVRPGRTYLGSLSDIKYAYYTGRVC